MTVYMSNVKNLSAPALGCYLIYKIVPFFLQSKRISFLTEIGFYFTKISWHFSSFTLLLISLPMNLLLLLFFSSNIAFFVEFTLFSVVF